MKKLVALGIAACMTLASAVNCFAYTKVKLLAYMDETMDHDGLANKFVSAWETPADSINEISSDEYKRRFDTLVNGGDYEFYIVTDEFKYVNGTAMVKLKDVVNAVGGKIEYNVDTKAMKAYIPNIPAESRQFFNHSALRSLSITPEDKKAYFSLISYEDAKIEQNGGSPGEYVGGSCDLKVTPTIIDDSLYVSAIDLGDIFGRYYVDENTGTIGYDKFNDSYDGRVNVRVINSIVYIPLFGYYRP